MFVIDDNFLTNVGYDVATLGAEEKEAIIADLTKEMDARITERFFSEVNDAQAEEVSDIQENPDRARRWLDEFHTDYRDRPDFQQIAAIHSEDDAVTFYATSLWFGDAIPMYGELIRDELQKYQADLAERRKMVNDALGL